MKRYLFTLSILLLLVAVVPAQARENRIYIIDLVPINTPTTSAASTGVTIAKSGTSLFEPIDLDATGAAMAGIYFRDIKVSNCVTNYGNPSGVSLFVTAYWTPSILPESVVKAQGGASQVLSYVSVWSGATRTPVIVDWVSDKRRIGKYLWFEVENLSKVSGCYVAPRVIIRGSK